MKNAPKWEELVGGIGATKPLAYATAKGRRRRKPKAKPCVVVRNAPPVPIVRELLAAISRWSRLGSWWLFGARMLCLLFPETASLFSESTVCMTGCCWIRDRSHIYGFA